MKKICILLIFVLLGIGVHASGDDYFDRGIRFFWSFGDFGVSWDNVGSSYMALPSLKIANLNWMTWPGFGWGFHLFSFEGDANLKQVLILPAEINYSPLGYRRDGLMITLYGRGGLMTQLSDTENTTFLQRSSLFGAAGLRIAWFPALGKNWSIFNGGFIEYTSQKYLRIGLSIDLTVIAAFWLFSTVDKYSDSGKKKHR